MKAPALQQLPRQTVTAGWLYAAFELTILPELLDASCNLWQRDESITNLLFYSINFLFTLWIFRNFLRQELRRALDHPGRLALTVLPGFLALQLISQGLGTWIAQVNPGFSNVNDQAVAGMLSALPFWMPVGLCLFVPLAEECLYRGLIFSQLLPEKKALAYGLSTAAFCCIHVLGYLGQQTFPTLLLCALQYVPAGLVLAWAYASSGTIFAPVLIHSAVNAAACLQAMR